MAGVSRVQALASIRDSYKAILALTAKLHSDSDPFDFLAATDERELLLRHIERTRRQLDIDCEGWRERAEMQPVLSEILDSIERIAAADHRVQKMMENQMSVIKSELGGLHTTSRATKSYISQSRI